jgi:hypothetical protein
MPPKEHNSLITDFKETSINEMTDKEFEWL